MKEKTSDDFIEFVYDLFKRLNKFDKTNEGLLNDNYFESLTFRVNVPHNVSKKIVKYMRKAISLEIKRGTDLNQLNLEEWGFRLTKQLPKKTRKVMKQAGIDPVDEAMNFFYTHSVRIYCLGNNQFMILPEGCTSHEHIKIIKSTL